MVQRIKWKNGYNDCDSQMMRVPCKPHVNGLKFVLAHVKIQHETFRNIQWAIDGGDKVVNVQKTLQSTLDETHVAFRVEKEQSQIQDEWIMRDLGKGVEMEVVASHGMEKFILSVLWGMSHLKKTVKAW